MSLSQARVIDYQLRQAGELAVYGTQKGYALLDEAPLEQIDPTQFRLIGAKRVAVVREGAFSGLTKQTTFTVGGIDYTILDIGSAGTDGLRRLLLARDP